MIQNLKSGNLLSNHSRNRSLRQPTFRFVEKPKLQNLILTMLTEPATQTSRKNYSSNILSRKFLLILYRMRQRRTTYLAANMLDWRGPMFEKGCRNNNVEGCFCIAEMALSFQNSDWHVRPTKILVKAFQSMNPLASSA